MHLKSRHQQRGATALGTLIIVAILGLGLYGIIRLVPVYLDYYEVGAAMEKVANETPAADTNPEKIKFALNRHWLIEDIGTFNYTDMQIRRSGSGYEMTADYRVEVPFIGNVSLVVAFNKSVRVD